MPGRVTLGRVACALGVLGIALLAFGWWGIYTAAGRRAYDEMAGMIPFFGAAAGGVLLVIALVLLVLVARRQ